MNEVKTIDPSQYQPASASAGAEEVPKPQRFEFKVEPATKGFAYTPNTDWGYVTGQSVRFQSPSGPFTITLERIDVSSAVVLQSSPLGTVLNGKEVSENLWATDEITAGDGGLSKADRDKAFRNNVPPGGDLNKDGFVARYAYHIKLTNSDPPVENDKDPKNGSFVC